MMAGMGMKCEWACVGLPVKASPRPTLALPLVSVTNVAGSRSTQSAARSSASHLSLLQRLTSGTRLHERPAVLIAQRKSPESFSPPFRGWVFISLVAIGRKLEKKQHIASAASMHKQSIADSLLETRSGRGRRTREVETGSVPGHLRSVCGRHHTKSWRLSRCVPTLFILFLVVCTL